MGNNFDLAVFLTTPVLVVNSAAIFEFLSSRRKIERDFYTSIGFQILAVIYYLISAVPQLLLLPLFALIWSRGEIKNRFLEAIGLEYEDFEMKIIEGKPLVGFEEFLEAMRKEFLYSGNFRHKKFIFGSTFTRGSSKSAISFVLSPLDALKVNLLESQDSLDALIKEFSYVLIEGNKKLNRHFLRKFENSVLRLYLQQCSSSLGKELEKEFLSLYKEFQRDENYDLIKDKLRDLDEKMDISKVVEKDNEILEEKLSILNYLLKKRSNLALMELENAKNTIIESQNRIKPKFKKISEKVYVPDPTCYIKRVLLNSPAEPKNYDPVLHSPLKPRRRSRIKDVTEEKYRKNKDDFLEYFLMPSLETIHNMDIRETRGGMNISKLKMAHKSCKVYEFIRLGLEMLDKNSINEEGIQAKLRGKIKKDKNRIFVVDSYLKEKSEDWTESRYSKFTEESIENLDQKDSNDMENLKDLLGYLGLAKSMIVDYLLEKSFEDNQDLWEGIVERDRIKKHVRLFFQRKQKYLYLPEKREKKIEEVLKMLSPPKTQRKSERDKEKSKTEKEEKPDSTSEPDEAEKEIPELKRLIKKWIMKKGSIFSFDEERVISNEFLKNKLVGGAMVTPFKNLLKILRPRDEKGEMENDNYPNIKNSEGLFENLFSNEIREFKRNFSSAGDEAEVYKVILDMRGGVQKSDSKLILGET